jgi:hypothetical protein
VPAGNFDYNPNDPTPGQSAWTYLGASGIANIPGAFGPLSAPQGSQVAFLQTFGVGGTSEVCQTLSGLTPGVEYFVSALLALRTGCPSCQGPGAVEYRVDGTAFFTDVPGATFGLFVGVFTAPAASALVCISEPPTPGFGDLTNLVDDAHVGVSKIFADGFEDSQ